MPATTGLTIPFVGLKKQYSTIRNEILDVTDEVLRSGQLMNGNYTAEFENWLARKNHTKYAVTCHSGTHALEILASYWATQERLPLHPRVLVPAVTYPATANAFVRAGWDVWIVDVDRYGLLDTKKIPHDIDYQAVVLVGLYGASVTHHGDLKSWNTWLMHDTIVIEDAAQHWLAADCYRIGSGGAAISFDPMKNLSCYGNGGAVVTDRLELAEYARLWRDNGKPQHIETGTNSRLSEIDCAQLLVKAKYLDKWQHRRATISEFWRQQFANTGIRCLIDESNAHDHAYHKFVIDIDNRDQVKEKLQQRKIETKIHYSQPLQALSAFRDWPAPDMLGLSWTLSRRVLSLPIYPELTDLEVEYISDQVLDCVS